MIPGILHILKTGGRPRDVPPEYGSAKTINNRYTRRARRVVWSRIFAKIAAAGAVPDELCRDRPMSRRIARIWVEMAKIADAVGVPRGGRATKVPCLADAGGRIVALALALALALTPGNNADITMALPLLEAIDRRSV